jgi:hypothetical protein
LFSTFPGGSPGLGLLILRVALGVTAAGRGFILLTESGAAHASTQIAGFAAIALGAFLFAGFLSPLVSLLTLFAAVFSLAAHHGETIAVEIYAAVLAAALGFLGPGAFSLDARFFGRREIVIPKD